MYCVKCGVKLADTEKKCPLCDTVVCHPDVKQEKVDSLYPAKKMPKTTSGRAFLSGGILILFMIPLISTFFADYSIDKKLDWWFFAGGGIALAYLIIALPMWFEKANPVIFIPCDFVGAGLYLLYINLALNDNWFLTFVLPILAGILVIVMVLTTLIKYLKRCKLFVVGGSIMGIGFLIYMIEKLMVLTFNVRFIGWSFYPLITLFIFGGFLIYLALNRNFREKVERKIFF